MRLEILTTTDQVPPVSLSDLKRHLRIDHAVEDVFLQTVLDAAIHAAELVTWRSLIANRGHRLHLHRFPPESEPLYLHRPPFASLVSVTYRNPSAPATWLSIALDQFQIVADEPAQIVPVVPWSTWTPSTFLESVRIEWRAGGASPSARLAILFYAGACFEKRSTLSDQDLSTFHALLERDRYRYYKEHEE